MLDLGRHTHTDVALPIHPWPKTNARAHTHARTQSERKREREILLRRALHYTGITQRNVLIKLCRQLQTARRGTGNDVGHQALKEKASRGLCVCVCVYNVASVCQCSFLPLFNMSSCKGHAVSQKNTVKSYFEILLQTTEAAVNKSTGHPLFWSRFVVLCNVLSMPLTFMQMVKIRIWTPGSFSAPNCLVQKTLIIYYIIMVTPMLSVTPYQLQICPS